MLCSGLGSAGALKAITLPSGDQSGSLASSFQGVTWWKPFPSIPIVKIAARSGVVDVSIRSKTNHAVALQGRDGGVGRRTPAPRRPLR
jgi:hypothetical protein